MILITGAAGKTGLALLRQLDLLDRPVRALVPRQDQVERALEKGATETRVGDLLNHQSMAPAFAGVTAVYHIPPNVHPQEERIAENILQLSSQHGVEHFVYHSVLRPYIRAMPHHIKKAHVEEQLFTRGIPFTIIQPAAYMQNTLPALQHARANGNFSMPYPVDTPMGMVDLDEVAEVGAHLLSNADHYGATYELSGAEILTPKNIARLIEASIGQPVEAQEVGLKTWRRQARQASMSRYQVATLSKMFRYYARHGFWGNANTLAALLGRPPKTYAEFLAGLDLG